MSSLIITLNHWSTKQISENYNLDARKTLQFWNSYFLFTKEVSKEIRIVYICNTFKSKA